MREWRLGSKARCGSKPRVSTPTRGSASDSLEQGHLASLGVGKRRQAEEVHGSVERSLEANEVGARASYQ
jgi:hypothetical protein